MSILSRQLARIIEITGQYDFSRPFPAYLSAYFKQHPEMGSRDRKWAKELCYAFFRTGKSMQEYPAEIQITAGVFLSASMRSSISDFLFENFASSLTEYLALPFEKKLEVLKIQFPKFKADEIFPLNEFLSPLIDKKMWIESMFMQPDVYIRIRERYEEKVLAELKDRNILFSKTSFPPCFSVIGINQPDQLKTYQQGGFEFQDKMSQRTRDFFKPQPADRWWDACAASGGKSLLLLEAEPNIKIEATDIRPAILKNYGERLKRAGWKGKFKTSTKDLTGNVDFKYKFDGIIADVPCSGSGTWSRNPEWLSKYQLSDIHQFVQLQRAIVNNLLPALESGKPLIYITCSAFFLENEDNIRFFETEYGLKTEQMQYLSGYREKADTLFACRMIMP